MNDDSVATAFDLVISEIEQNIVDTNLQGAASFQNADYDLVGLTVEAAKRLESFKLKVMELRDEWSDHPEQFPRQENPELIEEVKRTIASHGKAPKTVLVVKFSDGTTIYEKFAAETFVSSLVKLGLERVEALKIQLSGLPLVSTRSSTKYPSSRSGRYFIVTHSSTAQKRAILEQVAKKLGESLSVNVVPG